MSWSSTNDETYILVPNFASGEKTQDVQPSKSATTGIRDPIEDELYSLSGATVDTIARAEYVLPTLKFFRDTGKCIIPRESSGYYNLWIAEVLVRTPQYDSGHGYFACDSGYHDLANWKAGYQYAIYRYDSSDNFVQRLDQPGLQNFALGNPEAMADFAEFYKDEYKNVTYKCFNRRRIFSATLGSDDDLVQVFKEDQIRSLPLDLNASYDMDGTLIQHELTASPPTDLQEDLKRYPFWSQKEQRAEDFDDEDFVEIFTLNYHHYLSTYPEVRRDLRNHWKTHSIISDLKMGYVREKCDSIYEILKGVIEMPKEFRVKMQPASNFQINKISSFGQFEEPSATAAAPAAASTMGGY